MDKEQIKLLISKYLAGDCNEQESALLESWYNHYQEDQDMMIPQELILQSTERVQHRLNALIAPETKNLFRRLSIAASILLAVALGVYLFAGNLNSKEAKLAGEINPGKHGATLTLADGRKIKLSDATNGQLAKESGLSIIKTADGQLVYQMTKSVATRNSSGTAGVNNTLSTSNGEIFQLVLPDGSKVWLNAASTLSYSVSLASDKKRLVSLNGEAYFEVFKDKKHPFVVNTNHQQLEVLGTHFNINSYTNEELTRTTLLEGLVKIRPLNLDGKFRVKAELPSEVLLHPGQQSSLGLAEINIQTVDPEDAIAWKNGKFLFNDESLESIMRKISRWYNVEVVYNNEHIKAAKFYGAIDRFSSIEEVLKMLRLTKKVSFKIEGRRITVFAAEE
jgi:transmembrane sensor